MALIKIGKTSYNGTEQPVYLMTGGATRDAEDKPVNGKDHCVVGIAAAEDAQGKTIYVNLNGWRGAAAFVRAIQKGDSILAVGALKSRDYNGNTYWDLDADFVAKSGAGLSPFGEADFGGAPLPDFGGAADGGFEEIPDDGELPF